MHIKFLFFYCIHIIVISYINSACTLGQKVSKSSECLRETTNEKYCCFISPLEDDSEDSICYPYDKDKYHGNLNINYGKKLYAIDCGIGSTYMDKSWNMTLEDRYSCGKQNPKDYKDCSIDSTDDNSCCFYEGNDLKRCYWLGIKYTGKANEDGYKFICHSKYFFIKKLLYSIITFFIIY